MADILKKRDGESSEAYLWRIGLAVDNGTLSSWRDIVEDVCKNLGIKTCDESCLRKKYQSAKSFFDAGVFDSGNTIAAQTKELKLERMKIQTEKLELNRWLRAEARHQMIAEGIEDAIGKMPKIEFPAKIEVSSTDKEYLLAFGDEHYGAEVTLPNLTGGYLNVYNPEICEARMTDLLGRVIKKVEELNIKKLNVLALGDFEDGCGMRISQLMRLRFGIVEGTVRYANFLAYWLNELSKYVVVDFNIVSGNHTELRFLNAPAGSFPEENMDTVLRTILECRLTGNENFHMGGNPTGLAYFNLCGTNIVATHNAGKNAEATLKNFESIYNVPIDVIIGGHLHHEKIETIGKNKETLLVPSIIGTDSYALSLGKHSGSAAVMYMFEEGCGRTGEYIFKLN